MYTTVISHPRRRHSDVLSIFEVRKRKLKIQCKEKYIFSKAFTVNLKIRLLKSLISEIIKIKIFHKKATFNYTILLVMLQR